MTSTALEDKLYSILLESPLGVHGAEQTLPALKELAREIKTEKFWEEERTHHLADEQIIYVWASYPQDLRELRERVRQRQRDDELLSWLVMFLIEHYADLARTSALYIDKYQLVFDMKWSDLTPEQALACRDDWQTWAVEWLRNALRQTTPGGKKGSGDKGGGDDGGDGNPGPEPSLKPKPASDGTGLEY